MSSELPPHFTDWIKSPSLLLNKRVCILWARGKKYEGVIEEFGNDTRKHTIRYDDGDKRAYDLQTKTFWILSEGEEEFEWNPTRSREHRWKLEKGRRENEERQKQQQQFSQHHQEQQQKKQPLLTPPPLVSQQSIPSSSSSVVVDGEEGFVRKEEMDESLVELREVMNMQIESKVEHLHKIILDQRNTIEENTYQISVLRSIIQSLKDPSQKLLIPPPPPRKPSSSSSDSVQSDSVRELQYTSNKAYEGEYVVIGPSDI